MTTTEPGFIILCLSIRQVMRKEKILMKDHSDYVKSERDLLTSVLHPYIVTLRFSFQVSVFV